MKPQAATGGKLVIRGVTSSWLNPKSSPDFATRHPGKGLAQHCGQRQQEEEPLAAPAGGAEERITDPLEDSGLADHPRQYDAAEEQRERTASGVDDRDQIAAADRSGDDPVLCDDDAGAEQRRRSGG